MRAMVFDAHGGPEVLVPRETPAPEPGPGEVLVRVAGCGVNHLDLFVRQGIPGVGPFPHILGSEVSGTIEALGPGATRRAVGDRVVVVPGRGCGDCEVCRLGRENLCAGFRVLGNQRQGGYAEYVAVAEADCLPVNDRLDLVEWAAVPLVFQTAWNMLHTLGGVKSGAKILIESAGSGVGTAALQIAKLAGADVAVSAGGKAKCDRLVELGADLAVDHAAEDVRKAVLGWTNGRGVDLVIAHVGGPAFARSLGSLARGGRLVTCGATAGPKVEIDLRFLFTRELSVFGAYLGSRADLDAALALVAAGKLRPVIDRVYPLEELGEAHKRMAERDLFGKLVVRP